MRHPANHSFPARNVHLSKFLKQTGRVRLCKHDCYIKLPCIYKACRGWSKSSYVSTAPRAMQTFVFWRIVPMPWQDQFSQLNDLILPPKLNITPMLLPIKLLSSINFRAVQRNAHWSQYFVRYANTVLVSMTQEIRNICRKDAGPRKKSFRFLSLWPQIQHFSLVNPSIPTTSPGFFSCTLLLTSIAVTFFQISMFICCCVLRWQ